MKQAMATTAVIEQAKGIIMGERRCTPDEAFALLTHIPQTATANSATSPLPSSTKHTPPPPERAPNTGSGPVTSPRWCC